MDESESQQSQSQADMAARSSLNQTSAAVPAAAAPVGMRPPSFDAGGAAAASAAGPSGGGGGGITAGGGPAGSLSRGSNNSLQQLVRPTQAPGIQASGLRNSNMNQCTYFALANS